MWANRTVTVGGGLEKVDDELDAYLTSRLYSLKARAGRPHEAEEAALGKLLGVAPRSWEPGPWMRPRQIAAAEGLAAPRPELRGRLAAVLRAKASALPPPATWSRTEILWALARLMEWRSRLEDVYCSGGRVALEEARPHLEQFTVLFDMQLLQDDRLTNSVLVELNVLMQELLQSPLELTLSASVGGAEVPRGQDPPLRFHWGELLQGPTLAVIDYDPARHALAWKAAGTPGGRRRPSVRPRAGRGRCGPRAHRTASAPPGSDSPGRRAAPRRPGPEARADR